MIKKLFSLIVCTLATLSLSAQGWPSQYDGVMLQGFYWDSFSQSKWVKLEKQADELSQYFSLVWLPQSGDCGGTSMGYDDLYWFPGHYNSSFGTEAELRSLIQTFKQKGIGTIADVVINHRKNVSNWVDFPKETYNGVTYELKSTDICSNDDKGATKTWAEQNGYQLSSNTDTGEGWDGMRDLDHKSENVQNNVKAYLKMLLNDLGYVGFRYDMVKGYNASFTKMYNEDSQPQFSVGECWDGTNTIKNWIDGTGKTSAAFDFQFRYTVRNAANGGDWRKLIQQNQGNWPLVSNSYESGNYKQYAVTFVENHDTEYRSSTAPQDPLRKDTLAANAYLLAMPGTPCVFLTHWIDCKQAIKAMIDVRRFAGIHNMSKYNMVMANNAKYAAFSSEGTKSNLLVVVGDTKIYTPDESWVKVLEGYHFAYYLDKNANTAWIDLASGEYEGTQKATLTAVTSNSGAQLVYTTDGSTPTANSTKVASGTKIDVTGNMTLKVGLLIGSTVSGIVTRTYTEPVPVEKKTIDIYVNTDNVGWTAVNFWTWGGDDSHSPVNGKWPGDKVTSTTTIGGKQWYTKQYVINGDDDFVNFVFSTGTGSPQTVDINNIKNTTYFEISTEKEGTKYLVNDVTGTYTDINEVRNQQSNTRKDIYDLQGRKVTSLQSKGIYIVNGKKVVIK
jgi:alpha-amylase